MPLIHKLLILGIAALVAGLAVSMVRKSSPSVPRSVLSADFSAWFIYTVALILGIADYALTVGGVSYRHTRDLAPQAMLTALLYLPSWLLLRLQGARPVESPLVASPPQAPTGEDGGEEMTDD